MSIPLEKQHDFLKSFCTYPIIIYRFYPHGSKKLEDLQLFSTDYPDVHDYMAWLLTPRMILHDQEPLNFDLYPEHELRSFLVKKKYKDFEKLKTESVKLKIIDFDVSMHLRGLQPISCHIYDHVLLCHSEKNSCQLQKYQDNGFIGVYYWSHALIARDWYRFAQHDLLLITKNTNKKFDFLIYNRDWTGSREYRLKFADLLIQYDLVKHSKIRLRSTVQDTHYSNHFFSNPNFIPNNRLEDFFAENNAPSDASANYDAQDYADCAFEIVLETLFDDHRLHLTEKTLRPIACGHPFILVAPPGSLEYLRSYGFQTFSGLIDESYDTIIDPVQRLHAVLVEMQKISRLDAKSKQKLLLQAHAIAEKNKEIFFSDDWQKNIVKEFNDNFESATQIMEENRSGKYFQEYIDIDTIDDMIKAGEDSKRLDMIKHLRKNILEILNNDLQNQ